MKPAYIKWYGKKTEGTRIAYLKAGTKGKGKTIATVTYLCHQWVAYYLLFKTVAEREGYIIISSDKDEE